MATYVIKRFRIGNNLNVGLRIKSFGKTYENIVGDDWVELKNSDIFPGARRVDDDVLYKYNMEWIVEGPVRYIIERTDSFNNDIKKSGTDRSSGAMLFIPDGRKLIKKIY